MGSKNRINGYMCCMLLELLFGFVSLCYWGKLRHDRVYNSEDVSTLTCGESFHGCCPIYSGCGESEDSFLSDIQIRYLDIEVLDYEKTNCPSLYDIIDRDKDFARWKIFRPGVRGTDYCKINSACDKFTRLGTTDFSAYIRSVSVGMYVYGTDLPTSGGCDNEWMINSVVTNFNEERYFTEICGYMYLSLFSFLLIPITITFTCIETTNRKCSDCLPNHSTIEHVQLKAST